MWQSSLPIEDFREINRSNGENPPKELPISDPLGGLDIRCGPILRLCGTHEKGEPNYRGTIMIVVKNSDSESSSATPPKITYKIGPSHDESLSSNGGEFPGTEYYTEKGFSFWRFAINLTLGDVEQRVKYYINDTFKKSFQFFIPSSTESMNVVSYSCNGFSLGVDPLDFKSSLWYDVLQKHDKQHYHVMLGGGDQIYADSIKLHSESLQKWMSEMNPIKKSKTVVDEKTLEEFHNYYLHHYLGWFGKGYWEGKEGNTLQECFPLTMSQIPSVNIYDDHDIIDGFGSYKDSTMNQEIFKSVGNVAYLYYMLFQHHTSPDEKLHTQEGESSWILSKKDGPFIKQKNHSNYIRLGKEISVVGVDCRTERKLKQVVDLSTYDLIFKRLKDEITAAPEVKHLLVMLGVPILYPRLVWLEWLLTSSILAPARALAIRGVINKGLVNEFDGGVEVLDDLNDHWCSKHHKRERNYLLKMLSEFGALHGVRITILSGDVHLGCIGRLKSKIHHHPHTHLLKNGDPKQIIEHNTNVVEHPEEDPRLIFNIISSAIINTPPPDAMATLLDKRSSIHHFNKVTDEDILHIFLTNPDGSKRDNHQFLNKRNWSDLILGKQSIYADSGDLEKGISKFPAPLSDLGQELVNKNDVDERHVKYPLTADTLVTTLHVEDDSSDFDCKTASYEVLIPQLVGKYKIESPGIKHLH
ncbi:hypothetical protein CAAN1_06S00958 [[Candida] anglica]|uniref:PhoD-like phosphatase domain-containing protein n=1 Tax=[Candida] anglica TaxID=148631 RepID=A0ABP0EQP4_9ASCO